MTDIRVGLVGFGLSAQVFHAPFIQYQPEMTLAAVCSSQSDKVKQLYPGAEVVAQFDQLLSRPDLDLLVITTPNHLHFSQAQQALLAGKHVLLEKPSVTDVVQIEQLCALAQQQGVQFCVYQNRRFDADFAYLKELVQSQKLGQLKHLDSRFDRFRPQAQQRWRELPGEGTGIFWDLGPHLLDQALALLGPPQWVQGSIDILRQRGQTHDWFELELGYPDMRVKLGSTPFEAGEMRRFNARFEGGSWHCFGLDPQEDCLRQGIMPWQAEFPSAGGIQRSVCYGLDDSSGAQILAQVAELPDSSYKEFYQAFTNAILTRQPLPVPHDQATMLVYGMQLALQSAEQGQRLAWQYQYPGA